MSKKIAIMIESDYYEPEIWYYLHRFQEAGFDTHFLTRLWGQPSLTFKGHEYQAPFKCEESFEGMSDADLKSFSAIIVPSGMVSDRLRFAENPDEISPATLFLSRAFAEKSIIKALCCHAMWLMSRAPQLIRDRKVVVHNNLIGDAQAYGAIYTNQDVVIDDDLITCRTGNHCHLLIRNMMKMLQNP